MFRLKEKEYTINTFIKALRDKDKSYIGTYYETDYLDSTILANPTIDYSRKDDIFFLGVTLKPSYGTEVEQIGLLNQYMDIVSAGYVAPKADIIKDEFKGQSSTPINKFLDQKTVTSGIQDYEVEIIMGAPKVTRIDTVINGIKYQQYALTERIKIAEDNHFDHTIYCLFKDKTSDGENFFSPLVDKKLGKRDTEKVLDSIGGKNITGFFIGGYSVRQNREIKGELVNTRYYSTTDPIEVALLESGYHLRAGNGGTYISNESIVSSEVTRVGDYRYTLSVETPSTTTEIYIG